MLRDLQNKILALKEKTNTAIIAHSYQTPDILEVADLKGDSFALSTEAKNLAQKRVLMCGVRFMAETVKILNPQKTVVLVAPEATCPMAEQISPERVRAFKKEHPEYLVAAYINTTAKLKEVCDVCVTSSTADKIISKLEGEKILFIPDCNLGSFVQKKVPQKKLLLWEGGCPVHTSVTALETRSKKERYPDAKLLVHPECPPEIVALADFVGSTADIINYALHEPYHEFIIGTEIAIIQWLAIEAPERRFHALSPKLICPDMKLTTLGDVYYALLEKAGEEICMEEESRLRAKKCIDKMIELGSEKENDETSKIRK